MLKKISLFIYLCLLPSCFAISKAETEFFETKIRPILAQNCYKCHSSTSEKVKGKLLLDNKAGSLKGGETGPAIVPGDLEKSLLFKSISYKDSELKMPPSGRLPESVIKDFQTWIQMGAPDPREGQAKVAVGKLDEALKTHWSYQPLVKPLVPNPNSRWGHNEIDKFILEKLSANKLIPSLEADKKILIRRLYYDLIGIPPTIEEVEKFVNDKSLSSYDKLVDKLLAMPQYGERWARYWLDTSRYSDTSGSVNGNRESRYTYAYTYRNYVIKALNEDKPFNQFILEQIAADKLPNLPKENLAALGFITLGKDSGNVNDTIDDRIDVIAKGFMATTVVCARCHDHKFDPISTKDYYALHGVFNSSYVPVDDGKPVLRVINDTPEYRDYLAKKAQIEKDTQAFIDKTYAAAFLDFSTNTTKWLYGGYLLNSIVQSNRNDYVRDNKLNPKMIQRWTQAIKVTVSVSKRTDIKGKAKSASKVEHPAFLPYAKMFSVNDADFPKSFRDLLAEHSEDINPFLLSKLKTSSILKMSDLAAAYGRAVVDSARMQSNTNVLGAKDFYEAVYKNGGPLDISRNDFQRYYSDNQKTMRYDNQLRAETAKLVTHEISHPATPERAMAIADKEKPANSYVFIKGEPSSRGPVVERRFFEFFSYLSPNNFTNGSGRLEVAKAIADPKNPLTARVIVNRVWSHHFGEGFVKTPDDFGTQCEQPTQLELLNYLAARFIEDGWSIKKLHKLILTSAIFKQSSLDDPRKSNIDPYNKYYWRMNIVRLDFEALRDTILYVGGKLSQEPIRQPKDLFSLNGESYSNIRSVYGLVDRNRLPEALTTFDFATPEMTTGKRFKTTVPKQALFLMNNSLVVEQVRNVVNRPEFLSKIDERDKVDMLYQIFYQRSPTPLETKIATYYVKSAFMDDMSDIKKEYNWKYGFRIVDAKTKVLGKFTEFTSFDKDEYSSTNSYLNLTINRNGGKASSYNIHGVRQWISPREGQFDISATIKAKQTKDPINLAIYVYKNDKLIFSRSITNSVEAVIKIPTIKNNLSDKFEFSVVSLTGKVLDYSMNTIIQESKDENSLTPITWNSASDFRGPIRKIDRELGAWERYAHALMMSNEMIFIN